jgi:hypothetical protein
MRDSDCDKDTLTVTGEGLQRECEPLLFRPQPSHTVTVTVTHGHGHGHGRN